MMRVIRFFFKVSSLRVSNCRAQGCCSFGFVVVSKWLVLWTDPQFPLNAVSENGNSAKTKILFQVFFDFITGIMQFIRWFRFHE
ncbi:hypothetical protein C435_17824 [Haloarcula marismortui ATCC 33799]|uniref:Uncharacterized protein n=1 Tax=Haloarcula marismortui ATCC 33799 TaxID=662475 RepID=M0JWJ4_9EURY|nr:hypothetical protein C435_17824 [Haloarcula californiae ATCC 33799]